MRAAGARAADLRGFAWPLAAAERQREHRVDQARAQLAVLERERHARVRELDLLRSGRDQELQRLASLREGGIDLALHRHAIRHLQQALARQSECEEQVGQLQARVRQAQACCADAQQGLEAARKLREEAQARYVRDQARRDAKEADLAWLAGHGDPLASWRKVAR